MEYATLGCGELQVSRVGMGCWAIGGHGWGQVDDEESFAAVRKALELGINFFDTADCYGLGHSEELLSRALGEQRHEVVVASKFGVRWDDSGKTWRDCSPQYLRLAVEASLRRLRLERLPLYYAHWPDGRTPVEETMGALARLKEEGKIGWIGLSNHAAEEVNRALEVGPVTAIQNRYSLIDRESAESLMAVTSERGVSLVAWGALAQGLLTGKFGEGARFGADDHRSRDANFAGERYRDNIRVARALGGFAEEVGVTAAQLAIRWLLEHSGVGSVLFGAKRPSQVIENAGACSFDLDSGLRAAIAGLV